MKATLDVPLFELTDAAVRRGGRIILHVDHFEIREGEHICLLGPNGAGKSTFIQLLTREVMPLYRERPPVLFRGKARPILSDIQHTLGIVSSTMTDRVRVHVPVIEIVVGGLFGTVGLPLHGSPTDADFIFGQEVLGHLGIRDLADRDVMTLSSGELRRVLVARELIRDPEVLVFDEPTTGLDPEGMYYLRQTMRILAKDGKSLILVTHYPEDIIPEVERVLLLSKGEMIADGPKAELLRSDVMSKLFEVPLQVSEKGGWYALQGVYT